MKWGKLDDYEVTQKIGRGKYSLAPRSQIMSPDCLQTLFISTYGLNRPEFRASHTHTHACLIAYVHDGIHGFMHVCKLILEAHRLHGIVTM